MSVEHGDLLFLLVIVAMAIGAVVGGWVYARFLVWLFGCNTKTKDDLKLVCVPAGAALGFAITSGLSLELTLLVAVASLWLPFLIALSERVMRR